MNMQKLEAENDTLLISQIWFADLNFKILDSIRYFGWISGYLPTR